jgi:hypothetical protein
MRSNPKETDAVLQVRGSLANQSQVGLMDQVAGLEAASRTLAAHVARSDFTQLTIGKFNKARFRFWLAFSKCDEKPGYFAIVLGLHEFLGIRFCCRENKGPCAPRIKAVLSWRHI